MATRLKKALLDEQASYAEAERFRLQPTMKQGTPSSIPEASVHYRSIEDAREAAKEMYHDDRVLRVMLVADSPGTFVEWIER